MDEWGAIKTGLDLPNATGMDSRMFLFSSQQLHRWLNLVLQSSQCLLRLTVSVQNGQRLTALTSVFSHSPGDVWVV